ncbi:MAG: box helicase domain protein [Verrucomicrobiaceae bacterium]|nr:box helicase domain protein [Verrucomicrobiaceae bacterium]
MNASDIFHPAVAAWLHKTFGSATITQTHAWPAIKSGRDVLIAAPTGSGKTLAAFMSAIDTLVCAGIENELPNKTSVLYVSPLKALSNDIQRNLEMPLAGIRSELDASGHSDVVIRAQVRTGDTSQAERTLMRRNPPHIIITTPESLYVLLGSESGRDMLRSVRTVIVDEIHALVGNKRGSHLALSLERLQALLDAPLQRIGLSATQKPIETVAKFLIGAKRKLKDCVIVDSGHVRERDLQISVPPTPLEAVLSNEMWQQVYDQLTVLINSHHTTLIFVNTRRHAERVARYLSERIGTDNITAHHGSLSKELRFDAEQRLKNGQLKALVATASLELGIDIGDVDLVCQIGSCRSIATFLQRAGRANHSVTGTPKARLFPLSRDELVEAVALLEAVQRGELDHLIIPEQPLDVLAQQIVAEVAAQDYGEDDLFKLVSGAYPYRNLKRAQFDETLELVVDGYGAQRGHLRQYIHRDAVHKQLRGRRGARLTSIMSGGTIPDNADYNVVLEPEAIVVGTVNEDFAVESIAGDIFQLGNTSYRIIRVEMGRVRVEDAKGLPPTIPFWLGEAPGRSDELSLAVAHLRHVIEQHDDAEKSLHWLIDEVGIETGAATQLVDYLTAAKIALGALPTQDTIIFERFFDETGGMQLVIHAPFGSRINRAWGLALRKRFCRKFNFELQAAATEDSIIISLSTSHSFPLEEVAHYLNSRTVRDILIQALLDAPMFAARWRWAASIALALPRFRGGKKTPPQLQRMFAEDLIADVFPDQIACAENLSGPREIPNHPLVQQTLSDCLEEAMDIHGLQKLLRNIEQKKITIIARDVTEPSPLALQVLAARPYQFLDDAPLEERRTQAVMSRRWLDPKAASDLGQLDAAAIARVREEAFPEAINADELHDALMRAHFLTDEEIAQQPAWSDFLQKLIDTKRATCLSIPSTFANDTLISPSLKNGAGISVPLENGTLVVSPILKSGTFISPPLTKGGQGGFTAEQNPPQSPFIKGGGESERSGSETQSVWIAAERIPRLIILSTLAKLKPKISAPEPYASEFKNTQDSAREKSVLEIVRGRLEILGPVTAAQLAAPLSIDIAEIDIALLALEQEGFVLRGQFTPGANFQENEVEWCERGLLARIHRYTVNRLRAEIEPVTAQDFMRFLFRWQNVAEETRKEGPDALAAILANLEGFEAPAIAWEGEILPARLHNYDFTWLDDLCLAGRAGWARLAKPKQTENSKRAGPVRSTPIALVTRRNMPIWSSAATAQIVANSEPIPMSSRAQRAFEFLQQNGASFFDEIVDGEKLLPSELEEALGELVALGRVTSDSFAGIRALLLPLEKRKPLNGAKRRHRTAMFGIQDAGRWSLVREKTATDDNVLEYIALTLLRRYGVIFWRLLAREADWLPPWRDMLRVLRRMEARGEIRGGRFVAGITGEQFALPDALAALRGIRKIEKVEELICISGADPLNLIGTVLPGNKVPALAGNRILFRDGVPLGVLIADEIQWLQPIDALQAHELKSALIMRTPGAPQLRPLRAKGYRVK